MKIGSVQLNFARFSPSQFPIKTGVNCFKMIGRHWFGSCSCVLVRLQLRDPSWRKHSWNLSGSFDKLHLDCGCAGLYFNDVPHRLTMNWIAPRTSRHVREFCCWLYFFFACASSTPAEGVHHYVFFARERERIGEPSFLATKAFEGAQLKYMWRELEAGEGRIRLQRHPAGFNAPESERQEVVHPTSRFLV